MSHAHKLITLLVKNNTELILTRVEHNLSYIFKTLSTRIAYIIVGVKEGFLVSINHFFLRNV